MVDREVRLRRVFEEVGKVVMHLGIVGQGPQPRSATRRFEVRQDHPSDLDTTLTTLRHPVSALVMFR